MDKEYILGVYKSEYIEKDTKKRYNNVIFQPIIVSESIINWLNMHDVKYVNNYDKIYIVNSMEYIYLGENNENNIHYIKEEYNG